MTAAWLALLQQLPDSQQAGDAGMRAGGTTELAGRLFRFLFSSVPQWVQLAGFFIGVPVAVIVVWQLWKRRRAIWAWWVSRRFVVRAALVGAMLLVTAAFVGSGLYGYNYVMHENDFCQACHVMDTAWNRFQVSAHKKIECHDCHRQPLYVSTKELFWWVVERRMTVPPHDKVPTAVCSECHMRPGTDSSLSLVTLTAGHALHLRSDSSALARVECVTCHGRDFHKFKPTNLSCAQSGCHTSLRVSLGDMSRRGFQHCTSCHDFKGVVPAGTTVRQAGLALVPKAPDCGSCHAMTDKIRSFDLAADPHKGNCGTCHNVHKQVEPKDAFKTCATAQCHASADTLTAFHRGIGGHVLDQCGACHQAHSWKVKGTDCLACHETINQDRPRARRAARVETPAPVRRSAHRGTAPFRLARFSPAGAPTRSAARRAAVERLPHASSTTAPITAAAPAAPPADTVFRHSRHKSVACTVCHSVSGSHGGLTFKRPAGCTACHHSATQRTPCVKCHTSLSIGQSALPMTFAISARREAVTRPVPFAHARHATLACARCHAQGTARAVNVTCASCHSSHHGAAADCASCHPSARAGHDRASHEGCASCHADATVTALPASRPVCLACHQEQRSHYPAGDCATCHALSEHGMMRAGRARAGR